MSADLLSIARLPEEVQEAAILCGDALDNRLAALGQCLPNDSATWFDLLSNYPDSPAHVERFRRLKAAANGGAVERYGLLQAFRVALPRMASLPLHASVTKLFCHLCARIAADDESAEPRLDAATDAFAEMAKIATLRRLPAGQLTFEYAKFPRTWLLKVQPFALPGLLKELTSTIGGLGPLVTPHLSLWRTNRLVVLPSENELSYWRIAKTMELHPEVKGLMADSWFYSAEVGEVFPHLAWLRAFFVEQGAYVVDMEAAHPDSGFMEGSAKRRQLYQQRKFRPRRTLVLWPRQQVLAWANARPDLAEACGEAGLFSGQASPHWRPAKCKPADRSAIRKRAKLHSGQITLIDAVSLLNRHPKIYVACILFFPSVLAAAIASAMLDRWAAPPAFLLALAVLWLFQYFFLQ